MKTRLFVTGIIATMVVSSCGVNEADYNKALSQIDSLKAVVGIYEKRCSELQDSISILRFPADQRYNQVVNLVREGSFDEARKVIADLKAVFPKSKEAEMVGSQLSYMEKKEAEKKAEEERIVSLR